MFPYKSLNITQSAPSKETNQGQQHLEAPLKDNP